MKTLIVVDMQNDLIKDAISDDILAVFADYIKNFDGGRVIFVMDTKHDESETCKFNTKGWEVPRELVSAAGVRVKLCTKNTIGDLELIDICTGDDSDEIEICGLNLESDIVANALLLKTAYPERKITVISNFSMAKDIDSRCAAFEILEACDINIKE